MPFIVTETSKAMSVAVRLRMLQARGRVASDTSHITALGTSGMRPFLAARTAFDRLKQCWLSIPLVCSFAFASIIYQSFNSMTLTLDRQGKLHLTCITPFVSSDLAIRTVW